MKNWKQYKEIREEINSLISSRENKGKETRILVKQYGKELVYQSILDAITNQIALNKRSADPDIEREDSLKDLLLVVLERPYVYITLGEFPSWYSQLDPYKGFDFGSEQ